MTPHETRHGAGRRFARRRWARRLAAWRATLLLCVATALVGTGVYVVGWSQVLAVEGVDVEGAAMVSDAKVREIADVPEGQPLARVDLDRVRSRLESLAVVAEVDVSRSWPDRVLVSVTERDPVAVVEIGGSLRGLDTEGVTFRRFDAPPPAMPLVETEGPVTADALREAAAVVVAMPAELSSRVASVGLESVDAITLTLRDGRSVRWGTAESSEQKAAVLDALLRGDGRVFDVSTPGRPTSS